MEETRYCKCFRCRRVCEAIPGTLCPTCQKGKLIPHYRQQAKMIPGKRASRQHDGGKDGD